MIFLTLALLNDNSGMEVY